MGLRFDIPRLQPQKEIYIFDKKEISKLQQESNQYKLLRFKNKLNLCGHTIIKEYRCKQCEDNGLTENLLAFSKGRHDCKIRFCSKPDCICQRFAEVLESLESIKRFENLRTLHHFVIGFKKISREQFENNFDKIKKEQERVMNYFMKKLRNKGVKIEGYRVLDISKGKKIDREEWDKQYFIHYHFVAIPFKRSESSKMLTKIHQVRKEILKRQRKKVSFHFQSFGLINKKPLFSYISLRAIGLYKQYEPKKDIYKFYTPRDLRKSLEEKKFTTLNELIDEEQYLKYFFQHRHLSKIGELPALRYGSNRGDNILFVYCKRHGKLDAHDREVVSISTDIDPDPPPEGELLGRHEIFIVNASKVEVLNKETGENKELSYKIFKPKPKKDKQLKEEKLRIEYHNLVTGGRFKGTMKEIRRNEFRKELERRKSIVPKEFFRNSILDSLPKLKSLPELENFECQKIKDMKIKLRSGRSVYEHKKFMEQFEPEIKYKYLNLKGL